ncbi:hypothetical protein M434DRAFT_238588 [Hypoxylon sp. CO27-5]|nr:hypothetical protein M434DRAFT_238588 [Hypoxylon sp. CO27-5]
MTRKHSAWYLFWAVAIEMASLPACIIRCIAAMAINDIWIVARRGRNNFLGSTLILYTQVVARPSEAQPGSWRRWIGAVILVRSAIPNNIIMI